MKEQEFVSKTHAFCLDFHAYQTISAEATTPESVFSIAHADDCATASLNTTSGMTTKTMPKMMFAQRFVEFFRVRDRKAIINGTNPTIANSSNSSGPIFMPSISPVNRNCCSTPGSISINISQAKKVPSTMSHSTEIFIFQSSNFPPPP